MRTPIFNVWGGTQDSRSLMVNIFEYNRLYGAGVCPADEDVFVNMVFVRGPRSDAGQAWNFRGWSLQSGRRLGL